MGRLSTTECTYLPTLPWQVLGGLAWCRLVLGGGLEVPRPPWTRHVGVRWRQRLVVWVE